MPDWDSTERSDSDEDAAWRDLVARFDSPITAQEPVPWPEREDTSLTDAGAEDSGAEDSGAEDSGAEDSGAKDSGIEDDGPQDAGRVGAAPAPSGGPPNVVIISASGTTAADWPARSERPGAAEPPESPFLAEEHFVPPPPPPLPKLDSMAKAAWLALFGGPGYLLLATVFDWSLPGVAVFCAVAAFVAGVALLVFRLNDSDRDDSDDDGAVV